MIVFLTVYLGLIAGRQPIELRVDPAVKTVRLLLDGKKVDTMGAPPWSTVVDLGAVMQPHELLAVGFDEKGEEIARASQVINLPRPTAEVEIVLDRDAKGVPRKATVSGRHVGYAEMRRVSLKLDVVPLSLDRHQSAALPPLDMKRPHVLAAEMRFVDGTVAKREVVFGGEFAETMPTQLTSTVVTRTGTADTAPAEGCFLSGGNPLRVSSVEKANAVVIVVRDADPGDIRGALLFTAVIGGTIDTAAMKRAGMLDADTSMEILAPTATRASAPDQPTAILFPSFTRPEGWKEGLYWFITNTKIKGSEAPHQWADAVAVAGVEAVAGGRRRAVILVLGNARDASLNAPAAVRKYLASIGVPLFVWSVIGPRPDLADSWGPVEDTSSMEKMTAAAEAVKKTLDTQRIAWIYADPITALHADVKEGCGYAMLASR